LLCVRLLYLGCFNLVKTTQPDVHFFAKSQKDIFAQSVLAL
jgi:hypothetical protein